MLLRFVRKKNMFEFFFKHVLLKTSFGRWVLVVVGHCRAFSLREGTCFVCVVWVWFWILELRFTQIC